MTPYEQIADLAADLSREGFITLGDELRNVHRGIFNGTELYMAWRFHVAKAVAEPRLTAETRAKADALWQVFDRALS